MSITGSWLLKDVPKLKWNKSFQNIIYCSNIDLSSPNSAIIDALTSGPNFGSTKISTGLEGIHLIIRNVAVIEI